MNIKMIMINLLISENVKIEAATEGKEGLFECGKRMLQRRRAD